MKRSVTHEPAYVLHRYDWSESSLILDVFTRHAGRLALVAKGAKRPTSNFRPILLPLQPVQIGYGGEGEIRTLKSAEWSGGHIMPTGEALLSGYYANELLIRLLARDDPHPRLFDAYAAVVRVLATAHAASHSATLRAFELLLLRDIGLLPSLDVQTLALAPLRPDGAYELRPEAGLVLASEPGPGALSGAQWLLLQQALDDEAPLASTIRACATVGAGLRAQLRQLLHYHCGVDALRTRQLLTDLQHL
jgi:DNA repair protein RecO (recombination protein O)